MKRTKLLGVVAAAAMTLVLAACVYEDGVGTGQQQQQPVGQISNDPVLPTAIGAVFTPGTFRSAPIGGVEGTPEQEAWRAETGMGAMNWRRGPMVVEVDFTANQIVDIRVVSHGESAYGAMYLFRAYPMVPDQILMQQSTNNLRIVGPVAASREAGMDVFVGGTATQASIVLGVEDAIRQAGADPAHLMAQALPSRPLPGDRFVPGVHTVYVPAGQYMFNFDRNEFVSTDGFVNPQNGNPWPTEVVGSTAWGTLTSNVVYGYSRVLFANPIFGRNASAVHAPNLFESHRPVVAGVDPTFPTAAINNVAREMGFDPTNNPFYREGHPGGTPVGLWVTVAFSRNYFQLLEHAAGDGLGTAGSGGAARPFSGESLAPSRDHTTYGTAAMQLQGINGSSSSQALGGYWWIQTAHRSVNDQQSTLHIRPDTYVSATQSALGIRFGVEEAMRRAGATDAEIANFTPRGPNNSPFWREPNMDAGLNLIPGAYMVEIPGANGLQMRVVLCRSVIRYISFVLPGERGALGHQVAQADARAEQLAPFVGDFNLLEWANQGTRDNPGDTSLNQGEPWEMSFRARLLFAYAETFANGGRTSASLADVEPMPSNPEFSAAIIQALQTLVETHSYNGRYSTINQAGRLGQEIEPSPFR